MAATAVDIHNPAEIASVLGDANRRLARELHTPAAVAALAQDVAGAIAAGDDGDAAAVNPWLWIRVQRAALKAQAALLADDPERRRELRLALEQMRFLFARIAERAPIGDERPIGEVARWLDGTLESVAQSRKAQLLGVSQRTYQRWISTRAPSRPSGDEERRLRITARLVNQLRHSLTAPGVIDWFEHRRADLGGDTPAEALADPARTEALVVVAAASRGSLAA